MEQEIEILKLAILVAISLGLFLNRIYEILKPLTAKLQTWIASKTDATSAEKWMKAIYTLLSLLIGFLGAWARGADVFAPWTSNIPWLGGGAPFVSYAAIGALVSIGDEGLHVILNLLDALKKPAE